MPRDGANYCSISGCELIIIKATGPNMGNLAYSVPLLPLLFSSSFLLPPSSFLLSSFLLSSFLLSSFFFFINLAIGSVQEHLPQIRHHRCHHCCPSLHLQHLIYNINITDLSVIILNYSIYGANKYLNASIYIFMDKLQIFIYNNKRMTKLTLSLHKDWFSCHYYYYYYDIAWSSPKQPTIRW